MNFKEEILPMIQAEDEKYKQAIKNEDAEGKLTEQRLQELEREYKKRLKAITDHYISEYYAS